VHRCRQPDREVQWQIETDASLDVLMFVAKYTRGKQVFPVVDRT